MKKSHLWTSNHKLLLKMKFHSIIEISKCSRAIQLKGEIDSNTLRVEDFGTPLSWLDTSFQQKINNKMSDLKNIIDQMNLTDMYRIFHPAGAEYTFFTSSHGIVSRIDHIIGHTKKVITNIRTKSYQATFLIIMV